MEYPKDQVEELKNYCTAVRLLEEADFSFLFLENLRLPDVCKPSVCHGLLCPVDREGYPSRLYLSEKVSCPFERNWNVSEARIGEMNWFAFSWKLERIPETLAQMLVEHLSGFTRVK